MSGRLLPDEGTPCPAPRQSVDGRCEDQDTARDQEVDAAGQVEQAETVGDHGDHKRTDRSVDEASTPAEETHAADDRRSDAAQDDVATEPDPIF